MIRNNEGTQIYNERLQKCNGCSLKCNAQEASKIHKKDNERPQKDKFNKRL